MHFKLFASKHSKRKALKTTAARSGHRALAEALETRRLLAPLAVADTGIYTTPNMKVNIEVLVNDTWDSRTLPVVTVTTPPTNGSYAVRPDGSIDYTPTASGTYSLTYRVTNSIGYSSATATITVQTPKYLYVKVGGNDANSGNDWTNALASLDGARLKARNYPNQAVEIIFKNGDTFYNSSTVQFNSSDARQAQYPVFYRGEVARGATISGGKLLNNASLNWQPVAGKTDTYSANLYTSGQLTDIQIDNFKTLIVDGTSAIRAREPDVGGYFTIVDVNGLDPTKSFRYGDTDRFGYSDTTLGDGQDDIQNWVSPTQINKVDIVSYSNWNESRMTIQSVDTVNKTVTIQGSLTTPYNNYDSDYDNAIAHNSRYYVENFYQGLDQPGEWYVNTATNMIYYRLRPGESITTSKFVVPVVNELIHMTGASRTTFRGLVFSDTNWTMPAAGLPGYQSAWNATASGAIVLDGNTNYVNINNSKITNMGAPYAVKVRLNPNTNHITINDTEFLHNGGGAIEVHDVDPGTDNGGNSVAGYHRFALNNIHDNNDVWRGAAAIFVAKGGYIHINANAVVNTSTVGIALGWFDTDDLAVGHNQIMWNTVHDNIQVLYDGGAIYALGNQPSSVIMANKVYNVTYTENHFHRLMTQDDNGTSQGGPLAGIYIDQYGSNIRVMGNTIYEVNYGLLNNSGQRGMIMESNVIVDAQHAVFYSNLLPGQTFIGYNSWKSNVVSWTHAPRLPVFILAGAMWNQGPAGLDFMFDQNIYKYYNNSESQTVYMTNNKGRLWRLQNTNIGGEYHELNADVTIIDLFVNPAAKDFRILTSAQSLLTGNYFGAYWLFA